ncbi:hypothetical protein B0H10DRAFT_1999464 [Mycena sp. CBHHK59/15]|nr:hypothetical protein B0H10DRAFT_1999464 [Mycena sp. CBHHK59/15]
MDTIMLTFATAVFPPKSQKLGDVNRLFRPALQFALSGIVPTVSGDLVFTTLKWQLRLRPSLALKQREAMSFDRSASGEKTDCASASQNALMKRVQLPVPEAELGLLGAEKQVETSWPAHDVVMTDTATRRRKALDLKNIVGMKAEVRSVGLAYNHWKSFGKRPAVRRGPW